MHTRQMAALCPCMGQYFRLSYYRSLLTEAASQAGLGLTTLRWLAAVTMRFEGDEQLRNGEYAVFIVQSIGNSW